MRNTLSRWKAQGIYGEGSNDITINHLTFINDNVPIRIIYPTGSIIVKNSSFYKVRGDAAIQIVSGGDAPWDTHKVFNNNFELMYNPSIPAGAPTDSNAVPYPYAGPDCIQGEGTSGISIYNNIFTETETSDFYTSNQHPDTLQLTGHKLEIYNNEFINVGDSQIQIGCYKNPTPHDIWIYNNVFKIVKEIDPYPQSIRLYANTGVPVQSINQSII